MTYIMYAYAHVYVYIDTVHMDALSFLLFWFFLTIACFLPCLPITEHINAKHKIVKIAQKAKQRER